MARIFAVVFTALLASVAVTECGLRALVPRSFWNPPSHAFWDWLEVDPIRSWQNHPGFEHGAALMCSNGMSSGRATTFRSGTTMYSAQPPSR
jgi:hypothetical protein